MRDLVKTAFGFSLAMSLFGLEQVRNGLRRSEDKKSSRQDEIRDDLDSVSDIARQHLGDDGQRLFEAGDKFQRALIDMGFDLISGDKDNNKRLTDIAADFADRSADALRKAGERSKDDNKDDAGEEPKH